MKIAVVGGGINGIMIAWEVSKAGHAVEVFEKDRLMGATSSASSKILHGGLRYLEQFHFRLVAESLRERIWWTEQAPAFARPTQFFIPIYSNSARGSLKIKAGLVLYDLLAGRRRLGKTQWYPRQEMLKLDASLNPQYLEGAFGFFDVLMDDLRLGLWAARQAQAAGVCVHENMLAERIDEDGGIHVNGGRRAFDYVINVAGPWAEALLQRSNIPTKIHLDLVRGSHIVLDEKRERAYLLQVPHEDRICFALPYKGKTLIGTTEVRQTLDQAIVCSQQERLYLLRVRNHYFGPAKDENDIVETFSGLRPLVRSHRDPGKATREYMIQRHGRALTVFGGKWTTSRALGAKVAAQIL